MQKGKKIIFGVVLPLLVVAAAVAVMKTLEADGTSRLVVVDVAESVAAQIIAGDATPLYWPDGWMVSEP